MARPGSVVFEDLAVGQALDGRLTVTEAHIVLASGIFGDFAPLYVDAEFAGGVSGGRRPAPPCLLAGIMSGVLGKWFGPALREVLGQSAEFPAPVFAGDTLTTRWEVEECRPGTADGGIVVLSGTGQAAGRSVVVARTSVAVAGRGSTIAAG